MSASASGRTASRSAPTTTSYRQPGRTTCTPERHMRPSATLWTDFRDDAAVSPGRSTKTRCSTLPRSPDSRSTSNVSVSIKASRRHQWRFHIVGTIELGERFLPGLAGWLEAVFPAAVVAQDSFAQYLAVSVNAESHEEADADLDDALRGFAASAGLEDEVIVRRSSCAHGARDAAQLPAEIERFHLCGSRTRTSDTSSIATAPPTFEGTMGQARHQASSYTRLSHNPPALVPYLFRVGHPGSLGPPGPKVALCGAFPNPGTPPVTAVK